MKEEHHRHWVSERNITVNDRLEGFDQNKYSDWAGYADWLLMDVKTVHLLEVKTLVAVIHGQFTGGWTLYLTLMFHGNLWTVPSLPSKHQSMWYKHTHGMLTGKNQSDCTFCPEVTHQSKCLTYKNWASDSNRGFSSKNDTHSLYGQWQEWLKEQVSFFQHKSDQQLNK